MIPQKQKEEVAVFRFGVIAELLSEVRSDKHELRKLITQKASRQWDIPYSQKNSISETTIRRWLAGYLKDNQKLRSLYPKDRSDQAGSRVIDSETALNLLNLKKAYPSAPVTEVLHMAIQKRLVDKPDTLSLSTLYRFFHHHGVINALSSKIDRRRYEADFPGDLCQSDVMHGPSVKVGSKRKKTYLIALIDDHSRLITHAAFYLSENLHSFLDALKTALLTRGIPRKLFVDNGAAFRSKQLEFITASLQIALIHSRPYTPEGKGKIERFFRTVRGSFLSRLDLSEIENKNHPLMELNEAFSLWLTDRYHKKVHSSTTQTPLDRFAAGLGKIKTAPDNLGEYFRFRATRKVSKDRTVSFEKNLYEAPVELIGEKIELFYYPDDLSEIEAHFKSKSYGMLKPVDLGVNARVKRGKNPDEVLIETTDQEIKPQSGELFEMPAGGVK